MLEQRKARASVRLLFRQGKQIRFTLGYIQRSLAWLVLRGM